MSVSLNNLGRVAEARGRLDEAMSCFSESLDLARQLATTLGTPSARNHLMTVANDLTRALCSLGRDEDAAAVEDEFGE